MWARFLFFVLSRSPPSQSCVFVTPQLRPSRGPRGPTLGGFTQCTMAFSSSLPPFFPPSGTFRAHPARRLRADAPGRFVASCLPPPDVVVTREQGKNARLISALVSLPMDHLSIVLSCWNQIVEGREGWQDDWCCGGYHTDFLHEGLAQGFLFRTSRASLPLWPFGTVARIRSLLY